jgi:hypothetical protein
MIAVGVERVGEAGRDLAGAEAARDLVGMERQRFTGPAAHCPLEDAAQALAFDPAGGRAERLAEIRARRVAHHLHVGMHVRIPFEV